MKTLHMSLSTRGALKWNKRQQRALAKCLVVDGVHLKTPERLREFLLDCLADGNEVLPVGECDDFDPKRGCRGHEQEVSP